MSRIIYLCSYMALPSQTVDLQEYPADVENIVELDSSLLDIRFNLLNYVKAVINGTSLTLW